MRRIVAFPCAGETLVGTLDDAEGTTGVLIVSGGNDLRIGAHRGMAELAQRLATGGVPVLRLDRRGIGDSSGVNGGYATSGPDIAAAVATFRTGLPQLKRIVAFGNCDAATALALFHGDAGIDALALSNPWLSDAGDDALPAATAIRARYAQRLKDPAALWRLASGGVDLRKLVSGLRKASTVESEDAEGLAAQIVRGLEQFDGPITLLLARGDNTAVQFDAAWRGPGFATLRGRTTLCHCDSASHSYQHAADMTWLVERLVEAARTPQ